MEFTAQGAEAIVQRIVIDGQQLIRKHRFPKKYRHADLDARLTRQRTASEARALCRAHKLGLPVPAPLLVCPERGLLVMQYIADATTVKEALWKGLYEPMVRHMAGLMGTLIAKMHQHDMIHGDLTTSNVLVRCDSSVHIYFVDFGLAGQSASVEEKAVDMYVLERAVKATHSADHPDFFEMILSAYLDSWDEDARAKLHGRFEQVRARGRKRM